MPETIKQRVIHLANSGEDIQTIASILGITPGQVDEAERGIEIADPSGGLGVQWIQASVSSSAQFIDGNFPLIPAGALADENAPAAVISVHGLLATHAGGTICEAELLGPANADPLVFTPNAAVTVTNLDQSEQVAARSEPGEFDLLTEGWGVLTLVQAGVESKTGEDLTFDSGAIKSTAGGLFYVNFRAIVLQR